ncbi:P450 (cytochrome) oxidoreductase [Reticulomyxa filosa]|uniref:NADPH--hemoprotein reductase n=1 Tax=Reticulomyxa filosa TaxID=46433 RepID=X6NHJ2_RETFI|nr:P450 (cytochrome) oxidoreductase [Reticulomyxa filosa]|eukprot:ETO25790.1 P450 (cytochrome) oxidoreductase [Reticulomyxa filosa]
MFALALAVILILVSTYLFHKYMYVTVNKSAESSKSNEDKEDNGKSTEEEKKNPEENNKLIMKIFFGSQSGNAESIARDMGKEAKKYGFEMEVVDLEEYDPTLLRNEHLAIFVVSTYGEGEPTDNSKRFYQWLSDESHEEKKKKELSEIDFAVFGLGNSQYEFFNEMGKQFDQKLHNLGGRRLVSLGTADEDKEPIEDSFNAWKAILWPILTMKYLGVSIDEWSKTQQSCTLTSTLQITNVNMVSSTAKGSKQTKAKKPLNRQQKTKKTSYETATATTTDLLFGKIALEIKNPLSEIELKEIILQQNNTYTDHAKETLDIRIAPDIFCVSRRYHWMDHVAKAVITEIYETRPSTLDGSTLHVEFDIRQVKCNNGLPLCYTTADNLGIVTRNDHKAVAQLCKRLGVDPSQVIRIQSKTQEPLKMCIPTIVSIRNLFLWFLDISAPPKTQALQALSQLALDPDEKLQLQQMANSGIQNNKEKYWNFVTLLEAYPSVDIDVALVIDLLHPLQPRFYTISSSNKVDPDRVAITAKMEMFKLEKGDLEFVGVTSNYLRQSKRTNIMQVFVQPSSFRLPAPCVPVIMVATGAGLAPFRGFLQEGNHLVKSGLYSIEQGTFGHWWLFFGCRHPDSDYIYKDFLTSSLHSNGGCLKELKVAFSRYQDNRVYVQNLIAQNTEALFDLLIHKNAQVFVCGQPSMGKSVRSAFQSIIDSHYLQVDINTWLKSGKYVQELW